MSGVAEVAALVIAGIGLLLTLGRLPAARLRSRRRSGRAPRTRLSAAELAGADRFTTTVLGAAASAGAVHTTLRPLLREIATVRLAERRIGLDTDPEASRALLGPELWELVRPGRPAPADRQAPGLELETLRSFTDTLERLCSR